MVGPHRARELPSSLSAWRTCRRRAKPQAQSSTAELGGSWVRAVASYLSAIVHHGVDEDGGDCHRRECVEDDCREHTTSGVPQSAT